MFYKYGLHPPPAEPKPKRPCWTCEHWEVEYPLPYSAGCLNPQCCRLRTMPETGCVCWARATGYDDEESITRNRK